ncbi:hypothetical protein I314_05031 [Cryptococcus bacillisporus CA1873]|uniref:Uncharacterized protein n=2 Tax=Cryptococcus gattii TaxID=552467 RepID=A0A0D0THI1_CRYGA|nr:hypothetical protein I312_04892 [Cryptococcus bacillisporus CA1280]KIR59047.1 hypothetical protein I314_05031 [Cryptococcus bacillisporus CA1873]|eukprot:KIR59047.1 hypothetical protein I314_05031 [Cryptococcus gattii CA1873]
MMEPIEAEFAQPPILSDAQEETLRDEDVEEPNAVTNVENRETSSATETNNPSNPPHSHSHSPIKLIKKLFSHGSNEAVPKSAGDAKEI